MKKKKCYRVEKYWDKDAKEWKKKKCKWLHLSLMMIEQFWHLYTMHVNVQNMLCKTEQNTCNADCVWFTCSGLLVKAAKGNWQESVVTFCLWALYYVRGKLLLMSRSPVMFERQFLFFLTWPHSNIKVGLCENIFILFICRWPLVSVTWLHSSFDSCTDHRCGVPLALATEQPILCGLWSTNSLWPQRVVGVSIVWVLRARVETSASQLWLSYFRPQLYYLLLSCFDELFNSCPQYPKDRALRGKSLDSSTK